MQRDEDPVAGAQAAGPSTISDVLASLQLFDDSEAQVTSFIDSLGHGLNGPRFRKLLTYILGSHEIFAATQLSVFVYVPATHITLI